MATGEQRSIGLALSKRIITGLVGTEGLVGSLSAYPDDEFYEDALVEMPREHLWPSCASRLSR